MISERPSDRSECNSSPVLEVDLQTAGASCRARLEGELDLSTTPLVKALGEPVARCCGRLTLDVTNLHFLDAAGCRALRALADRLTALEVVGASAHLRRVLALAGCGDLLEGDQTVDPIPLEDGNATGSDR